jgi:hypothetical protein
VTSASGSVADGETSGACATKGSVIGRETMDDYDLAMETQAYQAFLEGHRADPDNELLYQDMLKAKAAMEIAWLQLLSARTPRASL